MDPTENPDSQAVNAELSIVRTTLALDRTLFASIRTALSLTAFGFTLAKFVHDFIDKGILHGVQPAYPRYIGFGLMALGLLTLLGGGMEYVRIGRKIKTTGLVWSMSLTITSCLAVLGAMLIWSLLAEIQGH